MPQEHYLRMSFSELVLHITTPSVATYPGQQDCRYQAKDRAVCIRQHSLLQLGLLSITQQSIAWVVTKPSRVVRTGSKTFGSSATLNAMIVLSYASWAVSANMMHRARIARPHNIRMITMNVNRRERARFAFAITPTTHTRCHNAILPT